MIEQIETAIENLSQAHDTGINGDTGEPLDFSREIETLEELILKFETVLENE